MKTIYKYSLDLSRGQQIEMPGRARILHFGNQKEVPTIWVEVWPEYCEHSRSFTIVGTGQEVPTDSEYIGSALFGNGSFVWHLYEEL